MDEEKRIGVGPHTRPWPTDLKYDRELLEKGDTRNVLDTYRYWTVEAIKADLDGHRSSLHVAIENWQHDLNIGTIVRTANAFNISTVHIIGKRHWNRRGAMVTDRYMNVVHHETVENFVNTMKNIQKEIIAVDIISGATSISKVHFNENIVFVFGGEGPGLSDEMKKVASQTVMIEQTGSTRSVNVGVAAGIAMYIWTQQHPLTHHI
jgi:tRNA G18 (ribose-2'-O)-methylase SpoU